MVFFFFCGEFITYGHKSNRVQFNLFPPTYNTLLFVTNKCNELQGTQTICGIAKHRPVEGFNQSLA